ncbi:ATP-binding cassette domain-containing protein [Streptomyces profundus]|uniref:ABC transporter ATP-binding protein n=1 Tax=Streptomyces profundus TaxID=2867410 RepID=UPI001D164D34|nr:ATP-binding cassette domain-containing protein [Streptomyces sp. MA3_2.13]UED86994.1 ATP-binding cassette domain-containing protein [Streptomyces sp. MA3_2.13]
MIQAIGLTTASQRGRPPAVDDLTFEARPGGITALLGPPGAGKSAALRLMLQLSPGRGVALFRGRPLSRVPHPQREIGTLLGDVPGHPHRSARGQLRMLAASAGVPAARADEVLEVVGLSGLADQRLGRFSRGMDRRLGLAAALLGDPHTLVLDEPDSGLSPRERAWLHGLLRGYAEQGGAVLLATTDAMETARVADRVVSMEAGRLIADQHVEDFARTRLRPRVAVRTPHAERLAAVLRQRFRTTEPVEVVLESGNRVSVYGGDPATVGEIAHEHRIVVHQLADEIGDAGDRSPTGPLLRADGRVVPAQESRPAAVSVDSAATAPATASATLARSAPAAGAAASAAPPEAVTRPLAVATVAPEAGARVGRPVVRPALPPPLPALSPAGPSWPLRYELRRWAGIYTSWLVMGAALLAGLLIAVVLASAGSWPAERVLTGWAEPLPLPPVAMAAGLLGALAFGQEFRYPALAPACVPVPRRLSLLTGKSLISAVAALLLCAAAIALNSISLTLLLGVRGPTPESWGAAFQSVAALSVGCAWAGLLAAGVFRSGLVGLVAVAAVPLVLAPALRAALDSPFGRALDGLPERLGAMTTLPVASELDRWLSASVRLASQPIGWALAVSLAVLLCGYAVISLRGGSR